MNNYIESNLGKLENELRAQKMAWQRSASSLILFTKSAQYTTRNNLITEKQQDYSLKANAPERMDVFLNTFSGNDTIATLHITSSAPNNMIIVRRVPYSGGAKWTVTVWPDMSAATKWTATQLRFTVDSFLDGELEIKQRGFE